LFIIILVPFPLCCAQLVKASVPGSHIRGEWKRFLHLTSSIRSLELVVSPGWGCPAHRVMLLTNDFGRARSICQPLHKGKLHFWKYDCRGIKSEKSATSEKTFQAPRVI